MECIKMLLDGGAHIHFETSQPGISWIFNGLDDEILPFEGNYCEVYHKSDGFLDETYWVSSEDDDVYIQANFLRKNEGAFFTIFNHGSKRFYFQVDVNETDTNYIFEKISDGIKTEINSLNAKGFHFENSWSRCAVSATVYKLNDSWLIHNTEVVYGKHPYSIDIIAPTEQRAKQIETLLNMRLRSAPVSYRSRYEIFKYNREFDKYNDSEESNKLRHKYLTLIKQAYEKFDFSDIFEYLADDCSWGGATGRNNVIEALKKSAQKMKENNYCHKCTLVQIGKPISPIECNTKPDGTGKKCFVGLWYHTGEICMIDKNPRDTLFFRMSISLDGKIHSYYATLPSGDFHFIDQYE
jgi:hypothetical protein